MKLENNCYRKELRNEKLWWLEISDLTVRHEVLGLSLGPTTYEATFRVKNMTMVNVLVNRNGFLPVHASRSEDRGTRS